MASPKAPSAKLIARRAAKVVLNHEALDEVTRASTDGLLELTRSIGVTASSTAPRDPEIAEKRGVPMMADTFSAMAFVDGKKVGGDDGRKPKAARLGKGIVVVGGFASPLAHLVEGGTIHMRARPFLTPALMAAVPDAGNFVREACIKHGVIVATRKAGGNVRKVRTALRGVGSGGGV